MRKKFILFALIPLAVLIIIVYIFIDGWVESGLETAGENIVGAKVEINNLHIHLIPIGLDWAKIQVANPRDPWRNIFQTGEVKFSMDLGQLLRGKYIINTMEMHDLIIGNKRTTSGALPSQKGSKSVFTTAQNSFTQQAKDALQKTVAQTPIFDVSRLKKGFNVDSLIKAFDFKTVKQIDTLKQQVTQVTNQWNQVKNDFEESKQKLLEIQKNVKAINPSSLNNVQNITAAISTVDKSVKSINEIKQSFSKRKDDVQSDIKSLSSSVGAIDDYVKADFQKLKSMAKLPSLNAPSIASLLAGSEMYDRAMKYLYWVDFARSNIKKYSPEPKEQKPPRLEGQNVRFPSKQSYPKFWIKKILITGSTDIADTSNFISAHGEVKNISSNQAITGLPLTVNLEGIQKGKRGFKFSGLFDRTKKVPYDKYSISLSGIPVGQFELGRSSFLPTKITDALMTTSVNISVPGNRFDSDLDFKFKNVKLQFQSAPKNIGERIVRNVLTSVNSFYINLRMWNTKGPFDVALATDLDDQISKKMMSVLGAEFAKLQNDLRAKFDAVISEKRAQFEKLYTAKVEDIKKQLDSYQALVNENLALIDTKKKELNDQLEKAKKGLIKDKLKDIFKN